MMPPRDSHQKRGMPFYTGFHRLLTFMIWMYAGFILVWAGLRFIWSDQWWWLGLINALALYLFLPLLLLIPLAGLQSLWSFGTVSEDVRRLPNGKATPTHGLLKKLWIGLVLPIMVFGSFWGKHFMPPALKAPKLPRAGSERIPEERQTLEVMTFNTLFKNQATDEIRQMLDATQPDIVALQEIHPMNRDAVQAALDAYPYQFYSPRDDKKHTIGIASRFPILQTILLASPPVNRGMSVFVDVDGQTIQVLVAHLTPNLIKHQSWPQYIRETEAWFNRRDQEMAVLLQAIRDRHHPTLILCDCNMTRTSKTYRDLSQVATDGFLQAGWGIGWTAFHPALPFPVVRLDYIWHTPELRVTQSSVGPDAESDHRPLTATVYIPPGI